LLSPVVFSQTHPGPRQLAVAPGGKYLYVSSVGSDWLFKFEINSLNDALIPQSEISGAPTRDGPRGIAITGGSTKVQQKPKYAYVTDKGTAEIYRFSVSASGVLIGLGSPLNTTGTAPSSIVTDPAGRFAYVANRGSNNIWAYNIDLVTGDLSPVFAVAPIAQFPNHLVVDPSGRFVYSANSTSVDDITYYSINQTTGALTSLGGFSAGSDTRYVTIDPTGQFLYAVNLASSDISGFRINPVTGGLTSLGVATPLPVGSSGPLSMTFSPRSYRATVVLTTPAGNYVHYNFNPITGLFGNGYRASVTGALSSIIYDPYDRFHHYVGENISVYSGAGSYPENPFYTLLSTYDLGPTNSLGVMGPSGNFLFTLTDDLSIQTYNISDTGQVSQAGSNSTGLQSSGLALVNRID